MIFILSIFDLIYNSIYMASLQALWERKPITVAQDNIKD